MSTEDLKPLTAHQFARRLLAGPDIPIAVPKVKEYSDDDENCCAEPSLYETDGLNWNDEPIRVLIIDQKSARGVRKPAGN